ncbi:MAG: FtsW/RodA/SpoVE family cell cycle protein [Methylobacteriaceae bacterium]|jgi:cell division protein FtsW|uniref:Probable peptidoglycan glycosyltransferase FtsW n=5 Tax=Methylorubrum extorquens TaxID=408 RepID=C5AWN9_METEA|nr:MULTISPECIES: putative peptidoglycan glycosyltransferase FtsW [Methylorubrum]KQO93100.1 cell division protein FtsW [Methylobacterium sp. Leaf90]KQP86640.1 cell division protein FtsW [Methylobacterium sp. Leaf119]KQQ14444.1 cell division protein FtsW [Methylobacterium sp. Leaf121]MBA9067671.1 cell division protein FtsW [Methylobacterium sp. RAS18]MDH6638407.1 cell division protein FtsW [Methylobacterium sp. SuP10 SLI 274]
MMSRAERSPLADWWWTVDRGLLAGLGCLMVAGLVFLMGGGPPVAERIGLPTFYFLNRQAMYLAPTVLLIIAVSFLSVRHIRRFALVTWLLGVVLCILAGKFGPEIKGAHRWIQFGSFGLQPSEFVKPAFVVVTAWAFSEGANRRDMPGVIFAFMLLPMTIVPLILQPDFGQTMLITMVWCTLFFVAGLHWFWVAGLGFAGIVGVFTAYTFLHHVRERINRFMDPESGDSFQEVWSRESFNSGGWFGTGPGEGVAKRHLPDAHTDFIFSVTGEEFGVLVCLGLVALFAYIVIRGLKLARRTDDTFTRLAITGLTTLFGLQACINMAVNTQLMPAKGMTLPFVSYGGSSLISLALGMGFLVALTRKRPRTTAVNQRPPGTMPSAVPGLMQ